MPDRIAVCQNPDGEGLYVPAEECRDGTCFQDCDCSPRVYVAEDAERSPKGEDHDKIMHAVEERRNDPEFMGRLERILREDAGVLERLAQGEDQEAGTWLIRVCEHGYRVEYFTSTSAWHHMDAPLRDQGICASGVETQEVVRVSRCPSPERRKYIVDWAENGDPILLDPDVGPPHPVVGTHDLPAPSPERDTEKPDRVFVLYRSLGGDWGVDGAHSPDSDLSATLSILRSLGCLGPFLKLTITDDPRVGGSWPALAEFGEGSS